MPTWSNNDINKSLNLNSNLKQSFRGGSKKTYSTTTSIINSRKDDDTGDIIRTITTENEKQQNKRAATYSITTLLTRANIISISIVAISLYGTINEFTTDDLVAITPNYQVENDFIPITDTTNIDYAQFGEPVVNNLITFIQNLGSWGDFAIGFWNSFATFLGLQTDQNTYNNTTTTFIQNFGETRWQDIQSLYQSNSQFADLSWSWDIYQDLTTTERNYLANTNPIYFGGIDDVCIGVNLDNNPHCLFTYRVYVPFGTKPHNNEFGWFFNTYSIVQLTQGVHL
jgi:hypothetical protein